MNNGHGGFTAHDELLIPKSDYAKRLQIATNKVKEIMNDDNAYIHWMLKIPEGEMLETCEAIIEQCEHPVEAAHALEQPTEAEATAAEARNDAKWLSADAAGEAEDWKDAQAQVTELREQGR